MPVIGAQDFLPSWFINPPTGRSAAIFASTEKEAQLEGAKTIAAYDRSIVWGDFQSFYDPSIDPDTWLNAAYYYYYDKKDADKIVDNISIAGSYVVSAFPPLTLFLLGESKHLSSGSSLLELATLATPSWADKFGFSVGNMLFGVGRSKLKGNPAVSWIKAEENAVFELLTFKSILIGSIQKGTKSESVNGYSQIEWVRLRYSMKGLQVVQRWLNPKEGTCMVLVSASINDIQRIKE